MIGTYYRLKNGDVINTECIESIMYNKPLDNKSTELSIYVVFKSGRTVELDKEEYRYLIETIHGHDSYLGWWPSQNNK